MGQHSSAQRAFEPASGLAYRVRATALFVTAVQVTLPDEAWAALRGLRTSADTARNVSEWARCWRIACPCVQEWAEGQVTIQTILGPEARLIGHQRGYDVPQDWLALLDQLNDTRLTSSGYDTRNSGKAIDPTRSLGPIAANPLAESLAQFLVRAQGHWEARADIAHTRGYRQIAGNHQLQTHTTWVARHHILQEPVSAIARGSDGAWSTDAVRKAIDRMRGTLQLKSLAKRGRPRKSDK